MASLEKIAARNFTARESLRKLTESIADKLGIELTAEKSKKTRDNSMKVVQDLETFTEFLQQIEAKLSGPTATLDNSTVDNDESKSDADMIASYYAAREAEIKPKGKKSTRKE